MRAQTKVQAAVQSPSVNSDALLAYYYMLLSEERNNLNFDKNVNKNTINIYDSI
jgi:hypothetical protein